MFDTEDRIHEETPTSERATGGQEEAHECRASFDDWDGTEVEITEERHYIFRQLRLDVLAKSGTPGDAQLRHDA